MGIHALQDRPEAFFVNRAFRQFFIPSFLSNTGLALGALADCLFVGSELGTDGLAAISIGLPIYMLFSTLALMLAVGGSIHYAKHMGKGDVKEGNQLFTGIMSFAFLFYVVLCALGLLFLPQLLQLLGAGPAGTPFYDTCARYVRAQLLFVPIMFCQGPLYYFINSDGAPRLAAFALVTSNVLDILFNYILVVRLNVGVEGSVYSTAIGASVMVVLSLSHVLRKKGALRFCRTRISLSEVWSAMKVGFPTAVQFLYQFGIVLLCNRLLMEVDGAMAVSLFMILYNLQELVVGIYESLSMTMLPMISTFLGEHNRKNILQTLRLSFLVSLSISLVITLALLLFPQQIALLFGLRTAQELYHGVWAIRIFAGSVILCSTNMIFTYYYQSVEQEKLSFILVTLRSFICFGALCLVLVRLGIPAFWLAYPLAEALTFLWLFIRNHHKHSWAMLPRDDDVFSVCLSSDVKSLSETVQQAEAFLEEREVPMAKSFFATNTIEEVCSLIIQKGFKGSKNGYIQLTLVPQEDGDLRLHIRDNAVAFNPFALSTDNIDLEEGEDLDMLGLQMVKSKAKDFNYRQYASFNTLVVEI